MSAILEDRLHRLADPLSAPASATALTVVHEQTRRLRRRRQVGQSVAAGVLGVAVVAGGLVATSAGDESTTEVGPVAEGMRPTTDDLPAVELHLDGFEELSPPLDSPLLPETHDGGSYQVFRRPGDLVGPTLWLRHEFASDTVVAGQGQEAVTVGGHAGALTANGAVLELTWNPDPGQDEAATLFAIGVTPDELLAVAAGLAPTSDVFGFVPSYLPAGVAEVALPPVSDPEDRTERQRVYDNGTTQVQMLIVEEGAATFEQRIEPGLQGCPWEELSCAAEVDNELVDVLGQPAVVSAGHDIPNRWQVYVRLSPGVTVDLLVLDADRATLDDVLEALVRAST